jgi:hypothetical protein
MKLETVLAGVLLSLVVAHLLKRRLGSVLIWLGVAIVFASYGLRFGQLMSVVFGIIVLMAVSMVTAKTWEGFEDDVPESEKEEAQTKKGKTPAPAPPKTSDPHVDVGTTILHAYRNLTPEQIGGMRRDTRELLELQKELMGSLGEMKPAIEQGAELLKTFSTFFGDNQQIM